MMFALILGVLLVFTQRLKSASTPLSFTAPWPGKAQGLVLAAPVAMLMVVFIPLMLAEHYTDRAQAFIKAGNMEEFGRAVNTADHLGRGITFRPYLIAAIIPLSILKETSATTTMEEQRALFSQIDGLLSKFLIRNSRSAAAWYHRGEMVSVLNPSVIPNSYPSAEDCFKRALAIDPLYLPARQALAQLIRQKGQKSQALDLLAAGLRWPYPVFDPMPYYEETEILAGTLNRPDIAEIVAEVRPVHLNRVQYAACSSGRLWLTLPGRDPAICPQQTGRKSCLALVSEAGMCDIIQIRSGLIPLGQYSPLYPSRQSATNMAMNNQDVLRYDRMVEGALRGVVRQAIQEVMRDGLPGDHHFYITFMTDYPGVQIPDYLRERYPGEMTIVLQYQFYDLMVDAEKIGRYPVLQQRAGETGYSLGRDQHFRRSICQFRAPVPAAE